MDETTSPALDEATAAICLKVGMVSANRLVDALARTRRFLLAHQRTDGTWTSLIATDPRPTAFYLSARRYIGRGRDHRTDEMEAYLRSEQLDSGAWEAWPGGGPDIDVTAACTLALRNAATERGERAKLAAQHWLTTQPFPSTDLFWKGYLALNRELSWTELPYFTTRLVSNPSWLRPNVYDFSYVRTAIVPLALIQASFAHRQATDEGGTDFCRGGDEAEDPSFSDWKRGWISEIRKPMRGFPLFLSHLAKSLDLSLPIERHRKAAVEWLLERQEDDGSFFSSVQMTSMAIVALHTLDASAYRHWIDSGLEAMHQWQVVDEKGRWQQFTDSTNWDTALCMDVLRRLGETPSDRSIRLARDYLVSSQNSHLGDWSRRANGTMPGGWSFQRVGKWFPDVDDTALIVMALLDIGDGSSYEAARRGIAWILGMQSSDGGWGSWDKNDRSWIGFPGAGPWLARDPSCTDITARAVNLLSRVASGQYRGFDDLMPRANAAVRRALHWLRRQREGDAWFGSWFTHYIYGTSQVLEALREAGFTSNDQGMRAGLDWLVSVANPDGGYGESPASGRRNRFVRMASTPFHTACALSAIVCAGAANHRAAKDAASWLLDNQEAEGAWTDSRFFASGVPGLWYANFALTQTCLAARSLISFGEATRLRSRSDATSKTEQ